MPAMQTMLTALNQCFGPDGVRDVDAALFAPDARLSDAVVQLGVADHGLAGYLDRLPSAIQSSLVAVIEDAVRRGMPVTFAWAPAYDYELTVWDVANTEQTAGGITVLLKSRYPADPHPLGEAPPDTTA